MHSDPTAPPALGLTRAAFIALMETIAAGWNAGNARQAADCFAEDAIYSEPPDRQFYQGRAALYEFFGGDTSTDVPMRMTWHHLIFDEATQIGVGEYTFEAHNRYHGLVIVKVEGGTIRNWREVQVRSGLDWEAFTGPNQF